MPLPRANPRLPTRIDSQRMAAEERFARYHREVKDLLIAVERESLDGQWDATAVSLNSALMTIGAMSGVCRELHLIYLLTEE